MVYLLADWGMGDSEICNRNYADKSSHDLLRIERDRDDFAEVDLHPLSNQVSKSWEMVWYRNFPRGRKKTQNSLILFYHIQLIIIIRAGLEIKSEKQIETFQGLESTGKVFQLISISRSFSFN